MFGTIRALYSRFFICAPAPAAAPASRVVIGRLLPTSNQSLVTGPTYDEAFQLLSSAPEGQAWRLKGFYRDVCVDGQFSHFIDVIAELEPTRS
jgi:hypothetical protein